MRSGVEGLVKTTERVAMKRRENMAETKIRKEKKLRRLNPPRQNPPPPPPPPPRLPLTATAIQFRSKFPDIDLFCFLTFVSANTLTQSFVCVV